MVAVGFRGAEGARARPAPNPRHQIPGAGPASVAVLAEGQGRAHAATCVRVADVARTYARIARCKIIIAKIRLIFLFFFFCFFTTRYLGSRSRRIRNIRADTCRNASHPRPACSNTGPRPRGRKSCAPRSGRSRRGRIRLPQASPRSQPFRTKEQDLKIDLFGGRDLFTHRTLIALPACHVRLALALTRHDVAGGAYRANGVASTPWKYWLNIKIVIKCTQCFVSCCR